MEETRSCVLVARFCRDVSGKDRFQRDNRSRRFRRYTDVPTVRHLHSPHRFSACAAALRYSPRASSHALGVLVFGGGGRRCQREHPYRRVCRRRLVALPVHLPFRPAPLRTPQSAAKWPCPRRYSVRRIHAPHPGRLGQGLRLRDHVPRSAVGFRAAVLVVACDLQFGAPPNRTSIGGWRPAFPRRTITESPPVVESPPPPAAVRLPLDRKSV